MPKIYEEQCELFIEQEIEGGLKNGKTPYAIAKEISAWVEKLFGRTIKPDTVRKRAERKNMDIVHAPSTPLPSNEIQEIQEIKFEHGGHREGAGRTPKFSVTPDNTQFRTSGTGENEWYTPSKYIEAARAVLGEIDLDPATSDYGQSHIKAKRYFTIKEDGLNQSWPGRVWLNPPYSQSLIQQFIEKLIEEYRARRTTEAILLVHNYTDTKWFHLAESEASKLCFTLGRIRFENAEGQLASPTQGQAFLYYGQKSVLFNAVFGDLGFVR